MGFDTETLANVEIDEKAARTAVDLWLAMLARKISLVGTTRFYKSGRIGKVEEKAIMWHSSARRIMKALRGIPDMRQVLMLYKTPVSTQI